MARNRPLVFDLVLTVADTPAWRRVRISSGATLARAQRVFCVALGWPGGRPSAFSVGHLRYESSGRGDGVVNVRLRQLLTGAGDALDFEYGDATSAAQVVVRVDCVLPASDGMVTPACLAGEGGGRLSREGHTQPQDVADDEEEYQLSGMVRADQRRRLPINLAAINAELVRLR